MVEDHFVECAALVVQELLHVLVAKRVGLGVGVVLVLQQLLDFALLLL